MFNSNYTLQHFWGDKLNEKPERKCLCCGKKRALVDGFLCDECFAEHEEQRFWVLEDNDGKED